MNIFNIEKYYYANFNPINLSFNRKRTRGFSIINAAVLDTYYNIMNKKRSFIEIGIGGGGPHNEIRECLDNSISVYGVDYFHPEKFNKLSAMYEKHNRNYIFSNSNLENLKSPNIEFHWGYDGYSEDTVEYIFSRKKEKFGVIIDDGDPTKGALNGLNVWKKHLATGGFIVTEGPFGNGVTPVYETFKDEIKCKKALAECSELNQMVIFDCSQFQFAPNNNIDYVVPYLGVYTQDWSTFKEVKDSKYHNLFSPYIVEGRQYYDA